MSGVADLNLSDLSAAGQWSMLEKPLVVSQVQARIQELLTLEN
jgi:hypothetical protein